MLFFLWAFLLFCKVLLCSKCMAFHCFCAKHTMQEIRTDSLCMPWVLSVMMVFSQGFKWLSSTS